MTSTLNGTMSSHQLVTNDYCNNYSNYQAIFLLLPLFVYTLIYSLQKQKNLTPVPSIPTVPGAHWLYGHLAYTIGPLIDPHSGFDRFSHLFVDHANSHGLTAFWIFNRPCVSILDARHARTVLRHGSHRKSLPFISRHGKYTLGDESLIFLEGGVRWKKQRSAVAYAFTAAALAESKPRVLEVAGAMAASLDKLCEREGQGGVEIDVMELAKMFTMQVFGKVALGFDFELISDHDDYTSFGSNNTAPDNKKHNDLKVIEPSTEAKAFEFLLNDLSVRCAPTSMFNPGLQFYCMPTRYNREYHTNIKIVRDLIHRIIDNGKKEALADEKQQEQHQQSSKINENGTTTIHANGSSTNTSNGTHKKKRDNMLTHIIRSNDDVSPDYLTKIITTLLFAGYETTAISIAFVLYNLSTNPRCQERVTEEARRVLGNHQQHSMTDIKEDDLKYTTAVFNEAMRLCPAVLQSARDAQKPIKLEGYTIPVGTRIFIPMTKVHTNERNFERPLEFLPERWVKWEEGTWVERDPEKEEGDGTSSCCGGGAGPKSMSSQYQQQNEHAETISAANLSYFFAFSGGARNCVGKRLATMEATIMIATLIKDFVVDRDMEQPLDMKRRLVSYYPTTLPLIFRRRKCS